MIPDGLPDDEYETGEEKRQRIADSIARAKKANRPPEEIAAWVQSQMETPDIRRTAIDKIGAGAQAFSDAATFGLSGLADDAITAALGPSTFAGNRAFRRENVASLPTSVRVGLAVAGSLATPLGAVGEALQAAKAAKSGAALVDALKAAKAAKAGVSLVPMAAENAPTAVKAGRAIADAALQSGVAGSIEGLDDTSAEGIRNAAQRGLFSAVMGGAIAPVAGRVAQGAARLTGRVRGMPRLDRKAFELEDAMAAADAMNYGKAAGEASSTPPIREVLESKTVAPYAAMIRNSETFQNADDATVLMEAYKLMSQAQRRAGKSIEGSPEFFADLELKNADIGKAKERMLAAAEQPSEVVTMGRARSMDAPETAQSPNPTVRDALDAFRTRMGQSVTRKEGTTMQQTAREALDRHLTENVVSPPLRGQPTESRAVVTPSETIAIDAGIPSLRDAINAHRVAAGELNAFEQGADVGARVMGNRSIPGNQLRTKSQEAFLRQVEGVPQRGIEPMTQGEAEAALAGVLGRGREQVRLSPNIISGFGVPAAPVRSLLASYRAGPLVSKLEKAAGRDTEAPRVAGQYAQGVLARLFGLVPQGE